MMINLIQGPQRESVDVDELRRLKKAGAVFLDTRRTRPLWFDGRFLKAEDLSREQNYFLTRQADLAVATGTGVIEGLMVEGGDNATSIKIKQGYGRTFGGEQVVIGQDLNVNLANVPILQRINVTLGLSREPAPPLRSRSGLFIVALRPLEFTANPVASYPTHIDERRSLHDGEIIEATAVTLVPYFLASAPAETAVSRRAEAADKIFVSGAEFNVPASSLPLAMIEMERGNVRWIDNWLVRREMGAAHKDVLGLGLAPRQLREAYFKQYDQMLEDVVSERLSLSTGLQFAATEYFISLPSGGRLPSTCIDMNKTSQMFFPPGMDIEISIVPEDEISTVIEESMLLPPIQLTGSEEAMASTSVMILIPVQRHHLTVLNRTLTRLQVPLLATITPVRSHLKPIDLIWSIKSKFTVYETPPVPSIEDMAKANWRSLVASNSYLWFVRRRNLSYKEEIVGQSVTILADEFLAETKMTTYFSKLNLADRLPALKTRSSASANSAMVRLMSSPIFGESKILPLGVMLELEEVQKLDEHTVLTISDRYGRAGIGEGIKRLEAEVMETEKRTDGTIIKAAEARNIARATKLSNSMVIPELDSVIQKIPAAAFKEFAVEIKSLLDDEQKTSEDIAQLILEKKRSLES